MTTEKTKVVRTLSGKVVSKKSAKTAVVSIERRIQDSVYGKFIRRSTRLHIHDAKDICQEGDTVLIKECRPVSKTKSWELVEVLEKAI